MPGKAKRKELRLIFKFDQGGCGYQTASADWRGWFAWFNENAGKHVADEELAHALQKAEGLGTAATRADIIEGLKEREYVDAVCGPTVKGIRLIDIFAANPCCDLDVGAELTAKLELHLSEVEDG